ncbi:MAG: UDP-N-acetylmuramate dehydrogenase [Bdellovibrionales bacterium]|nr:UDP-N-acetylmuramate dehydrogenase [Bdellovibrionales bacterium]
MTAACTRSNDFEELGEALRAFPLSVRSNVDSVQYTTFAIGGPLRHLVEVQTKEELCEAMRLFGEFGVTPHVLGFGSNLLLPDGGISGWVLKLGKGFRYNHAERGATFRIGGASALMTLSREFSAAGLSGLEFAGGIPASLGGAVRMNAGAHGGEISEVLEEVTVVDLGGQQKTYRKDELSFSYRKTSLLPTEVVYEARFSLVESDKESTTARRAECLAARKATQPLSMPSAGSVFKNPKDSELSAGALIEQTGLKGHSIGGAQVSELHANWIINPRRDATSQNVKDLIALCQNKVQDQFGIDLDPEIVRW